MQSFTTRIADWAEHASCIMDIRHQVFVIEQGVPVTLETDPRDPEYEHVLATAIDGTAVGTGRLLPDGNIGRMAVLRAWRGQGVGGAMLKTLVATATARGMQQVQLHAQLQAREFYLARGFAVAGHPFMEAGIEHVGMRRRLHPAKSNGPGNTT